MLAATWAWVWKMGNGPEGGDMGGLSSRTNHLAFGG